LVVLTTVVTLLIQTNWRDSGYEMFGSVLKINGIMHATQEEAAQFMLKPQYTSEHVHFLALRA